MRVRMPLISSGTDAVDAPLGRNTSIAASPGESRLAPVPTAETPSTLSRSAALRSCAPSAACFTLAESDAVAAGTFAPLATTPSADGAGKLQPATTCGVLVPTKVGAEPVVSADKTAPIGFAMAVPLLPANS